MKSKSVAISGYRPSKLALCTCAEGLSERIAQSIAMLIDEGFDTFYCGMAEGFDMMVARTVIGAKVDLPHIKLIAAIPFEGHRNSISESKRADYDAIMKLCDAKIVVGEFASKLAFLWRNDFMLERSSVLLCYYNGIGGGTEYTIKKAVKLSMRVVNICHERQLDQLF